MYVTEHGWPFWTRHLHVDVPTLSKHRSVWRKGISVFKNVKTFYVIQHFEELLSHCIVDLLTDYLVYKLKYAKVA